jgi:CRISPR-associated endonuclease Cas1
MELSVTESVSPVREIYTRQPDNPSVLVADGYNVSVRVARGHLVVEDGIGATRRVRRIPRVDATAPAQRSGKAVRIARLVVLSDTGFVSMEAIRWCADMRVTLTQVDRDGRILMSSPGLAGDSRLRIAQVRAMNGGPHAATGEMIMREILRDKIMGQAAVIRDVFGNTGTAGQLEDLAGRAMSAVSLGSALPLEGAAARVYFSAWRNRVFTPFSPADLAFVPAHWYKFNSRTSKHSPNMQGYKATDPVNALLNYAYAVCESEARYACHVIGLDPGIGLSHTDYKRGHSLAYDIMEVLRPEADRVVLSMLDTGRGVPYSAGKPAYFKVLWFCETKDAVCRLSAPLTHMITERIPGTVARLASDYAARIASGLTSDSRYRVTVPAPAGKARLETVKTIPVSDSLTVTEILPDHVWDAVRSLIPPWSGHAGGMPRADDRACLAGIMCHELGGVSWASVPAGVGVTGPTCRIRYLAWRNAGVMGKILDAVRAAM